MSANNLSRKRGFSLLEALTVTAITAILAVATMPFVTEKKLNQNFENNSVKCIKSELGDLNSTACQRAIKFASHKKMNAYNTLVYFADHGSSTEQTYARKVLRQSCDEGGQQACYYFVSSCKKDYDKCDIASSVYDLDYYLKLAKSNGLIGRMRIIDLTKPWYGLENSNIVAAVGDACCNNDEINTACDIAGTVECSEESAPGDAYCWGNNGYGQLGEGDDSPYRTGTPEAVVGGHTFSQISAGYTHTCGLDTTGNAYCWGRNNYGQLGEGDDSPRDIGTPVAVVGGHTFSQISVGKSHTCGLNTTGNAYCWGYNGDGRLGRGDTSPDDVGTPEAVVGGHTFSQISAGYTHTCGLDTTGNAYCWGDNSYGQVGEGDDSPRDIGTPEAVVGGHTFSQISAGYALTCGLDTTGNAYCWGYNGYGQVGEGDDSPRVIYTPTAVVGGHTFSQITAGGSHTCGLDTTGNAYCWGDNDYGQLGEGDTSPSETGTPVAVVGGHTFSQISAGYTHTCGLNTTGNAYCWGYNDDGQVGEGDTSPRVIYTPTAVVGGHTFSQITSMLSNHTCGIKPN